jgi:hypothetical protein
MSIRQMQQHLIEQINTVKDENILKMLDEELSYYIQNKEDLSQVLTEKEYEELSMLANEPIDKDTVSLSEFDKMMEKWCMK